MIVAIKWGKHLGNENSVISLERVNEFKARGYTVYDAKFRPGLYTEKKSYESQATKL